MSTTIEGTSVRLGRDPEDFRRFMITVQVYSRTRPGLKSTNDIDPGKVNGQQHLLQLIGAAGAACAEYLGEKYGENIDPATASQNAIRAFGEECRLQVALSKDAPAKVKRLEQHAAAVLKDHERELLHKLSWSLKHGEKLTPVEVQWVDQCLARVHNNQLH